MKILTSPELFAQTHALVSGIRRKKGPNAQICATTGHRLRDLPAGTDEQKTMRIKELALRFILPGDGAGEKPVDFMHVGGADGVDTGVGLALAQLKRDGGADITVAGRRVHLAPIPYALYIPMHGHPDWFKGQARDWYDEVAEYADVAGYCFDGPTAFGTETAKALTARNGHMLKLSNSLRSVWNGRGTGGTANCNRQARQASIPDVQYWQRLTRLT